MTQQFLDCSDIVSVLKQMGGKAVPKRMNGDALNDSSSFRCPLNMSLQVAGMNVMPADNFGSWID